MRLNNKELYDFFVSKNILALYHANTVKTSITYLRENGLLSRGAVENRGLIQTEQKSDEIDKILNVWDDIFLDSTDLHNFFGRQNYYGPVMFEFDIDLIQNENFEIWITKDNPIYWNEDTPNEERYFTSVSELDEDWNKYSRQKKMITIRNNSEPILFEYVRRIIVDDPRLKILDDKGVYFNVLNSSVNMVKEIVTDDHILKGKFIFRQCQNCYCRDNYLNQVSVTEIKKLFL